MLYIYLFIYNLILIPIMKLVFFIGSYFNKKLKQGRDGRKNYFQNVTAIAKTIPLDAKVYLFHSSSVGEWEQAVPIIEKLKENDSKVFVIVTFFSPSGFNVVKNPIIDIKLYMPIDSKSNARKFFKIFKPKAWIICKYDVWPNMLFEAKKQGIPVLLTSAELAEDSKRHIFPMKAINKPIYAKIDYILAISKETRTRFLQIFPFEDRLLIGGDSRYDRINAKAEKLMDEEPIKIFAKEDFFAFIMGSSWPSDEKHVLPALIRLMQKHPHVNTIFVPHEIEEIHLQSVEKMFSEADIDTDRYSIFSSGNGTHARVAIIDTVGILSKLYRITKIAYVGGAFGSGVHNVMEPAAFAQPVLFGPKHINSYEACQLEYLMAGHTIHNETEFEIIVDYLINREKLRIEKGMDARKFLVENLGATEKTITILNKLHLV